MRTRLVLVFCVALAAIGAGARAHESGISGASGKSGSFCNRCHSGGATPTVKLDGPASLATGASGTYTLTITGGAAVAGGLDAALDDAALAAGARLATVSPSTQLLGGEVTHTAPVGFAAGSLSFQLAVVAPATARTMTLYVAGDSTNRDGSDNGDKGAATTMSIAVNGPPPTAPPDFAGAPAGADLSDVTNPPDEAGMAPFKSSRASGVQFAERARDERRQRLLRPRPHAPAVDRQRQRLAHVPATHADLGELAARDVRMRRDRRSEINCPVERARSSPTTSVCD